ncbi:MAG: peptidoglycan editing factor PgeF [Rhodospirillaceae bacterium]
MITVSSLNALTNVRHGFFTRNRGVSTGIYQSMNCGFGSGDAPENVRRNREIAMETLEMPPEALVTLNQQHTATVVPVTEPWAPGDAPVADGMVTKMPRLVLGILTADCAPVLLADPKAKVIGACHAGWKGARTGVLEATIDAMEAIGGSRDRVIAGVGPCITQRSYEVGPEFEADFMEEDDTNEIFFAPSRRERHFLFDLPGYIAKKLVRAGVTDVMPTPCDTVREGGRFFSYRRSVKSGQEDYGRMLSAIALER